MDCNKYEICSHLLDRNMYILYVSIGFYSVDKLSVTRRKGYQIELSSSGLNIKQFIWSKLKTLFPYAECRLRWIENSKCTWDAAHSTLLRVTGITNPRSTFLPTFIMKTSK